MTVGTTDIVDMVEAAILHQSGYVPTSNKYYNIARIDRPDWREFMASGHLGGMGWVNCLGLQAADHYRRCFTSDTRIVSKGVFREMKVLARHEACYEYRELHESLLT